MRLEHANLPLPLEEANRVVELYNLSGRTARGVRLYLSGITETRYKAARAVGVSESVLSRALARMTTVGECGCCGHPVKLILTERPVETEEGEDD